MRRSGGKIEHQTNNKIFLPFQRSSRGYSISKIYAKVYEYDIARDWLQRYLDIKTEDSSAHRFMGDLYEHLKMPEDAITSYQRSYILNSKQNDLIKISKST